MSTIIGELKTDNKLFITLPLFANGDIQEKDEFKKKDFDVLNVKKGTHTVYREYKSERDDQYVIDILGKYQKLMNTNERSQILYTCIRSNSALRLGSYFLFGDKESLDNLVHKYQKEISYYVYSVDKELIKEQLSDFILREEEDYLVLKGDSFEELDKTVKKVTSFYKIIEHDNSLINKLKFRNEEYFIEDNVLFVKEKIGRDDSFNIQIARDENHNVLAIFLVYFSF